MNVRNPIWNAVFSSRGHEARQQHVIGTASGSAYSSWPARLAKSSRSGSRVWPSMKVAQRLLGGLGGRVELDGACHVGLHAVVVDLVQHRAHDEEGEEQRETDQHLVRRRLRHADRLAEDGEHDDDAGERRCGQRQRRQQRQRRHQQQDLHVDGPGLAVGAAGHELAAPARWDRPRRARAAAIRAKRERRAEAFHGLRLHVGGEGRRRRRVFHHVQGPHARRADAHQDLLLADAQQHDLFPGAQRDAADDLDQAALQTSAAAQPLRDPGEPGDEGEHGAEAEHHAQRRPDQAAGVHGARHRLRRRRAGGKRRQPRRGMPASSTAGEQRLSE